MIFSINNKMVKNKTSLETFSTQVPINLSKTCTVSYVLGYFELNHLFIVLAPNTFSRSAQTETPLFKIESW